MNPPYLFPGIPAGHLFMLVEFSKWDERGECLYDLDGGRRVPMLVLPSPRPLFY